MNNLNFALIRVECCNQYKNAPCRIALIGVKDASIVSKKEIFVDPEDAPFDFLTSGLSLEDLRGKGTLIEHWEELYSFIKKIPVLVSPADGYDTTVLHNVITQYNIDCAPIRVLTAKNIIRCAISTYSYRFDDLCELLKIEVIDNMPLNLATNWCELIIRACESKKDKDLIDFAENNRLVLGAVSLAAYNKCYIKRIYKNRLKEIEDKIYDSEKFDESNPFFDQNVVFTGKLEYFTRNEAEDYVCRIGGHCLGNLTKATNYLVVGAQSPSQVGPDGLSSKQKKAIKYREEGIEIELLSETDFIDMMGLQSEIDWKKYIAAEMDSIRLKFLKK